MIPIVWTAASIAGWALLPLALAGQWQALLVLSLFVAMTYGLVDSILPRDRDTTLKSHLSALFRDTAFASAQVVR